MQPLTRKARKSPGYYETWQIAWRTWTNSRNASSHWEISTETRLATTKPGHNQALTRRWSVHPTQLGHKTNFQIKPGGFGLLFFSWRHQDKTRTRPGKHLENTWSAGNWMVFCDLLPSESLVSPPFQRLNVLVPSKLNVFLRPGSRPGKHQEMSR